MPDFSHMEARAERSLVPEAGLRALKEALDGPVAEAPMTAVVYGRG